MTREEAREILAVFRAGTRDEQDPIFAEALALARSDAELKAWLKESVAFDRTMKTELARIIAPPDIRERILAGNKIIRPVPWWHRGMTRAQMAAAAVFIIAGALVALWHEQRLRTFAQFRREIADQSWGPSPHVEAKATNLAQVRRILDANGLPSRFSLPSTLAHSEVRGCSLMNWRGHEVPMICFNSEGQHLHLVVIDQKICADAPSRIPEMDQWQAWRTASWSKDDFSYVLTGLNTPHFVKKFRKSKRWDWEG